MRGNGRRAGRGGGSCATWRAIEERAGVPAAIVGWAGGGHCVCFRVGAQSADVVGTPRTPARRQIRPQTEQLQLSSLSGPASCGTDHLPRNPSSRADRHLRPVLPEVAHCRAAPRRSATPATPTSEHPANYCHPGTTPAVGGNPAVIGRWPLVRRRWRNSGTHLRRFGESRGVCPGGQVTQSAHHRFSKPVQCEFESHRGHSKPLFSRGLSLYMTATQRIVRQK
ncbi:hypothetical protein GPOL_c26700 [Gordonia polyisoprenivorans VH2]|uniref:Uncharacterized protein n=1 Tax=Gordonia polyisoprenivorans (strain DSM 44266 / VH2) TaxID=1112204 RepID=H6MQZ4_GORPV|nr:hypothetical protein GPOL_c26700 [Gordonia polyisoprenivorans VH2]